MKEILIIEDDKKISRIIELQLSMRALRRLKLLPAGKGLKLIIKILLLIWFYSMYAARGLRLWCSEIYQSSESSPANHPVNCQGWHQRCGNWFELGADDYHHQARYVFDELLARIKANIQKNAPEAALNTHLVFKDIEIDLDSFSVKRQAQEITLSDRIWSVLLPGPQPWSHPVRNRSSPGLGLWVMTVAIILLMFILNICVTKSIGIFDEKLIQTVRGRGYVVR